MTRLETIDRLIDMLVEEMPEYAQEAAAVPRSEDERRALLRALMNVRPPMPASERFLALQDGLLCDEVERRGVVDVSSIKPSALDPRLAVWRGDITRLRVGAIVNAANAAMLGCFVPLHRCIDNAIHSAAGVQLCLACVELMQGREEPTGEARITPAFDLPADYVVHTVGPIVSGALTARDCELLASCYRSCLDAAAAAGCASIAFCCISTGEFGFPHEPAAAIAVWTVRAWLDAHEGSGRPIDHVIFDVFSEQDERLYRNLLDGYDDKGER